MDERSSVSGGERRARGEDVTCDDSLEVSKRAEGWPERERRISWSMAAAQVHRSSGVVVAGANPSASNPKQRSEARSDTSAYAL